MYAVCVTFQLTPNTADAFMSLMHRNAETSLRDERGCHQFDVLSDSSKPDMVFLYELYADRAAFDAHLASGHFKTFDTSVASMIATKDMQTWDMVKQ